MYLIIRDLLEKGIKRNMNKIKILCIGMSSNLGGIETYLYNLVKNADKEQFEFHFLDACNGEIALKREIEELGVVIHKIIPRNKNYKEHLNQLKELYVNDKFDYIHYSLMSFSWFEPITLAKKYSDAKIIVHSHNGGFGKNVSLKTRILHKIGKFKVRNINFYRVACGEQAGRWMFDGHNFEIFQNGIDIEKFSFKKEYREEIRKRYNIKETTTVIGLIGKLEEQKNHNFLLDIFYEYRKRNVDSKLLLIGEGSLQKQLENKAKNLNFLDDIIFTGKVLDSYKFYSAFDIFVMPSLYEGLSIALVEAQVNGLKCYTSDGVDRSSNITGNVEFLSLTEGAEKWADCILDSNNTRDEEVARKIPEEFNEKKSYCKVYEYFQRNNVIRILQWGMTPHYGGVEAVVMNLYRNINLSKVQFDFLTAHDGKIACEKEIEEKGGKIYRVTYGIRENIVKYFKELDIFLKAHPEIVGIHMHSCFMDYVVPIIMAKKNGIKIRIYHSHNSGDMYSRENIIKKLLRKMNRFLVVKNSTKLYACSKKAGEYMFGKHEFEVLNNGIQISKFDYNEDIRKKYRNEMNLNDKIVVGFVGRLQFQKNPIFSLKVFNKLYKINKNYYMLIIGTGDKREEMEHFIKENNIEKNVEFLGHRSDVENLYQDMDIFLLPSIFEGLGLVLIEAQTSGLTCFASNVIPEETKITENMHYLSLNDTAKQWAEQIDNTIKNRQKRESQKQEIKNSGFDIQDVASELEKYYIKESR